MNKFLSDTGITDISYNGSSLNLQHNLKGRYRAEKQPSAKEVYQLVKKIADVQGKDFTPSNPILDTELSYIRVNAIHDSISENGVSFSIRLSPPRLALKDLSEISTPEVSQLLKILIESKSNIIISGATESGKTELQKTLIGFIPNHLGIRRFIKEIVEFVDFQIAPIQPHYKNTSLLPYSITSQQTY